MRARKQRLSVAVPVAAWAALTLLLTGCAIDAPSGHGPRQSPGSERVRRLSFAPLQVSIPRVGREVDRRVLPNGIILYLTEDHSLPVLDVYAVFRAGSLYEAIDRPGVAQVSASQLRNGGTARHPADALNEELEVLGASIEASASDEAISVSLSALAKDTDQALSLLAEVIRQPVFDARPLQTFKGRALEDLRRLADNPPRLLAREFTRTLYTEAHPLGRLLTPGRLEAIRPEDLQAHYRRFFHPSNMILAVVGDFRVSTACRPVPVLCRHRFFQVSARCDRVQAPRSRGSSPLSRALRTASRRSRA